MSTSSQEDPASGPALEDVVDRLNLAEDTDAFLEETEDDDSEPFIEPLPIINPPAGCTEKTRLPCEYQPLPTSTSIRLIQLHLIQDYEEHPEKKYSKIICSLKTVDLVDVPDYFALSYTWGDPRTIYTDKEDIFPAENWAAPAFEIQCDGKPVTVATNLYTALISIRWNFSRDGFSQIGLEYSRFSAGAVNLWIDALCINQDDLAEKSNQIPLMDRIYNHARATIMWLGGGESLATTGAIITIQKLDVLLERLEQDMAPVDIKTPAGKQAFIHRCCAFELARDESFHELGLAPISHKEMIGYYLYISRSWFKRAWVVQEWFLSPKCVFLCGALAMRHERFWERITQLTDSNWLSQIMDVVKRNVLDVHTHGVPSWNTTPGVWHRTMGGQRSSDTPELFRAPWAHESLDYDLGTAVIIAPALRSMMGYDRALKYPTRTRELFQEALRDSLKISVVEFRGMQAFDPRDKVYAFHGLLKNSRGVCPYPAADYSKTIAQVYIEAAQVMAEAMGPRLLAFVGDTDVNEHSLPSWVPDFSRQVDHQFLQDSDVFAAAKGLGSPEMEFWADDTILKIAGCHVDTIVHVQEEPLGAGDLVDGFRKLNQLLNHLPEYSTISLPSEQGEEVDLDCDESASMHEQALSMEQSRFEMLWRTKLKDEQMGAHPAPEWLGEIHKKRLQGFLWVQVMEVIFRDVEDFLEQLLKDSIGQEEDPFFAKCIARLGRGDQGMLSSVCEMLQTMSYPSQAQGSYTRQERIEAMTEINTQLDMVLGNTPSENPQHPVLPDTWHAWLAVLETVKAAREARDYDELETSLHKIFDELTSGQMSQGDRNLGGFADNQTMYATRSGRLGLDPGGVQAGDEIWLIPDLHVPIILRNKDEGYAVVGCSYVHGIMHGEAVPSDKATEEICLI